VADLRLSLICKLRAPKVAPLLWKSRSGPAARNRRTAASPRAR
jgi:hypothetical protein